ncbi:MAG: hypothetical protein ACD_73C00042G0002 [uncultured bacterium]|nr:MAG: hypothetical protein ACD_73C00042G0002 [uncultured bacterium]
MAIVSISRRATFNASHRLHSHQLSDAENKILFGKCNRVNGHGHNYVLEVTLRGILDEKSGILFDLTKLKSIIDLAVIQKVDHLHLNMDVKPFDTINPTAENMAIVFWDWLAKEIPAGLLYEVKLHETENNVAIYRGE